MLPKCGEGSGQRGWAHVAEGGAVLLVLAARKGHGRSAEQVARPSRQPRGGIEVVLASGSEGQGEGVVCEVFTSVPKCF